MDADSDISLPKATLIKMIKEYTPGDVRVSGDTVELMIECCTEFIQLMSSEANEVATKEGKNTICPEHVLKALTDLGFQDFVADVRVAWEEWKEDNKNAPKLGQRRTHADMIGLTEEQQIALQQQLFAQARARSQTLDATTAATMQAVYSQNPPSMPTTTEGAHHGQEHM